MDWSVAEWQSNATNCCRIGSFLSLHIGHWMWMYMPGEIDSTWTCQQLFLVDHTCMQRQQIIIIVMIFSYHLLICSIICNNKCYIYKDWRKSRIIIIIGKRKKSFKFPISAVILDAHTKWPQMTCDYYYYIIILYIILNVFCPISLL